MKVARWLPCAVRGIGVSALRVDFVMSGNLGKGKMWVRKWNSRWNERLCGRK